MSGGALNHLYYKIQEVPFLCYEAGHTLHPEIVRLCNDFSEYLHALEWYLSGDIGDESYQKELDQFLNHWNCFDNEDYSNMEIPCWNAAIKWRHELGIFDLNEFNYHSDIEKLLNRIGGTIHYSDHCSEEEIEVRKESSTGKFDIWIHPDKTLSLFTFSMILGFLLFEMGAGTDSWRMNEDRSEVVPTERVICFSHWFLSLEINPPKDFCMDNNFREKKFDLAFIE